MKTTVNCLIAVFFLASCQEDPVPKPRGYYRIDFPDKQYLQYSGDCPFTFSYPIRSLLDTGTSFNRKPCWLNLHYPQYAASVHFTFHSLRDSNLHLYIEDARKMALKHLVRADDINEQVYSHAEERVYGMVYDLEGGSASNFQFFLTDSVSMFFRGSMYFNLPPNPDSIAPVSAYIKEDLRYLIESFRWK